MLNIIGTIDGAHIETIAPKKRSNLIFNRKNRHLINIQTVVNSNLEFLNIVVKYQNT